MGIVPSYKKKLILKINYFIDFLTKIEKDILFLTKYYPKDNNGYLNLCGNVKKELLKKNLKESG